jgi:hypothetical protein|nr:MAG TPA: hypothetical protein [Caudoviricetes sp.]
MMYCNILRKKDLKPEKKQCFKTKYKNIVIVKLKDERYSLTHYQTGVAINFKRYTSINKALLDLDEVVYRTMEILKRNNITFEQFYKQKGLKQINF